MGAHLGDNKARATRPEPRETGSLPVMTLVVGCSDPFVRKDRSNEVFQFLRVPRPQRGMHFVILLRYWNIVVTLPSALLN